MKDARAELIRIDDKGEAHPIGAVAGQRMRAREGAFRVMPAPAHVVFMRYTGEDGRRDAEDGAVVKLAGEITAPASMCDIFAIVTQAGWRGELVVLDGESTRSVFFDASNIVGAQTTVDEERIGMVMYRYGALNAEQHEAALEKMSEGMRFGEACVALGVIPQEKVYQYIARQMEEIAFSIFEISDGTFYFLDGFDDSRLVSQHTISANILLMDGVTRLDEIKYFRDKIPTAEHVPVRTEGRGDPPEECKKVYAAVDGQLSVEDIGRFTGTGEFETTKALYTMVQSKHVQIRPPRISGGPSAVVSTANSALRVIHQQADAAGKGTVVRSGLDQFAVGAGVYDILFRSAGPDEMGALDPDRVAENAAIVAGGADPEEFLKQSLHEYVSFALFSAGSALGEETEVSMTREVKPYLDLITPNAVGT